MNANLLRFPDAASLAREAGRRFIAAIPEKAEFMVALSGGRISADFYSSIVAEALARSRNLGHVHFFFADERCVPPTDPASNFLSARQFLFDPLQIRAEQIHRIHGETDHSYAAGEAEAELCRIAPLDGNGQPIFDLVILGMGEDGHTASLFPGEPEILKSSSAVYRAVSAPKPPPDRITLGYAPLRAAREIWVLASGVGKEVALNEILSAKTVRAESLPLARVLLDCDNALIFSDIPQNSGR